MKKKLFSLLILSGVLLFAGCSKGDGGYTESIPDGPAGTSQMLIGTWYVYHMIVIDGGEEYGVDIEESISTMVFNSDGSLIEYQGNDRASAVWTYTPSSRKLRMKDTNGNVVNAYVKTLTTTDLIWKATVASDGQNITMIVCYNRTGSRGLIESHEANIPLLSTILNYGIKITTY